MEDVARAAALSRQSLYAYFTTKEDLFREVVQHLIRATRNALREALSRDDLDLEARLFSAFDASYGSALDDEGSAHVNELFAVAEQRFGGAVSTLERAIVADVARALREDALGAQWQKRGISSTMLADHLHAVSKGLKHTGVPRAEYRERMRAAIRIVCRGA